LNSRFLLLTLCAFQLGEPYQTAVDSNVLCRLSGALPGLPFPLSLARAAAETTTWRMPPDQARLHRAPVKVTRSARTKTPLIGSTPLCPRSGLRVHNLIAVRFVIRTPVLQFAASRLVRVMSRRALLFQVASDTRGAVGPMEKMPLANLCSRLVVNEHPLDPQLPSLRLTPVRPSRLVLRLFTCHRKHRRGTTHDSAG
jgi:hypothetical protein